MTIFHVIKYGEENPPVTRDHCDRLPVPEPIWIELRNWYLAEGCSILWDQNRCDEYHKAKKEKLHEILLNYEGDL